MQFLFAVDRENRRVADRFDPLSGPMLRALQRVVEKASGTDCRVDRVRRDRRAAARSHGADRARLPVAVDVADLDRPREGDAAGARRRTVGTLIREELDRDGGGDSLRPALIRFAKQHGIPV